MKKYLIFLLCVLGACSTKTPEADFENIYKLELSRETVKLANTQSSVTISVTSNGRWNVTVDPTLDWLSVSINNGKDNGSFILTATNNADGDLREGKITVSLENTSLEKVISIEQLGADPDILLSYPSEIIQYEGGIVTVNVTSNIEWEVHIEEKYNWIELVQEKAKSFITEQCRFRFEPNFDQKRTGSIVFRSTGEFEIRKSVIFTQEAAEAFLSIDQSEFTIPYRHNQMSIPVDIGESGVSYSINTNESWISWNQEASSSNEIVLTVEDNAHSDFPRSGEITISNGNLEETVKIYQYGKPNPRIGDDVSASVLAFPGAEGGGRFTTGGRGGRIYRVTNLLDYDSGQTPIPGSLRYGIDLNEPRTIIFDVSGNIELRRTLRINRANLSIIGQTAPGDGITLKNYQLEFNSGEAPINTIVRFIRIRTGDLYSDHEDDAIGGRWFKQAIIDHVSTSWCVDECISFYGVKDFTIQWSIGSESLNNSQHEKGAHGYGAIWSGANASFHHLLLAHHASRMPRIASLSADGPGLSIDNHGFFDVRNNVYYNWSGNGFGAYGGDYATFNLVNSYYKAGPATGTGLRSWRVMSSHPSARIYANGNHAITNSQTLNDNWTYGIWDQFYHTLNPTQAEKQAMKVDAPFPFYKTTTHSAEDAYWRVAEYAGASLRRDAHDVRIMNEMLTGTTTYQGSIASTPQPGIIDRVSDTDGYPVLKSLPALLDSDGDGIPDIWEDAYGLDKNNPNDANGFDLDNLNRYSNLEVYFHNLVQHIIYHRDLGGIPMEKH